MVAALRRAHGLIMEGGTDHFKVSNEPNRRLKERVAELFDTGAPDTTGYGSVFGLRSLNVLCARQIRRRTDDPPAGPRGIFNEQ